jgi:hypothetical protein
MNQRTSRLHPTILVVMAALMMGVAHAFVDSPSFVSAQPPSARECAAFVADVTIPDGTPKDPGQSFEKVWRLRNCGETPWAQVQAVRVSGTYGPPSFPVPLTAPGQVADLGVAMEAPTEPGCARATYDLSGVGGAPLAGFFVQIVVAGELPPSEPPSAAEPRQLMLPRADVGSGWCELSRTGDDRFASARYHNALEYGAERELGLGLSRFDSVDEAERSVGLALMPTAGARGVEVDQLPLGDGRGVRSVNLLDQGRRVSILYGYRVDVMVIVMELSGRPGDEAALDRHARELVALQEQRVRQFQPPGPTLPQ